MNGFSDATLIAAIVGNGLLAGVFLAFSCGVSPGLRRVDDLTYLTVFRAINRRIVNPVFMVVFLGAPLATAAATALHLAAPSQSSSAFVVAGLVLALFAFAVTALVNVPLNNALDAAPSDDARQRADARDRFEQRWNRWNHVRAATSIAAFVLLVFAV
ncbi:DUF1772 domain-containing protein [Agromyces aureus]|uniref:DUF1772 domain-containing protein n=1 Tax=Agromyces aureus TaxID=453304 RepID=A0A191WJJ1_9MICO|nr:anthrone oxygenase family protein [Agromyces aureus]ANJ28339.1 hypothetical protein ATC03_18180 [Agromyces aureus]